MWRPSALGSRRAPRERCAWSAGGRTSGGSRPASWAAPPWRGSGDAGPRQEPAAPVHGAGLVRLRAHAGDRRGRGGGAAAARPAGGGEWGRGGRGRGRLPRGGGARRALLQRAPVPVRPRRGRCGPCRARGRAARAGGAAARRAVRPARLPRRPAGVDRVAAALVGARPHRGSPGRWLVGDHRLPGAVQRRPRNVALVGAARRVDLRDRGGGGPAPAGTATGGGAVGARHGAGRGGGPAARCAVPERGVRGVVARRPGGRGGRRLRALVVAAGQAYGCAVRPWAHRGGRPRGGAVAVIERAAKIVNPLGMHARPAAEFVKVANRFKAAGRVPKDDLGVNGKSHRGAMMLAAECGSSLIIKPDGQDAEAAMEALLALVADGFHEMHLTAELREAERAEEEGQGPA